MTHDTSLSIIRSNPPELGTPPGSPRRDKGI
jgi:hypothetical protein